MKCSYCDKPAVYHRKYSGEWLCKDHFTRSIERKVLKTIREYLHPGIKIGLGVSGGKDSLTMSYIIRKITKRDPKTKLFAILIDENISDYREHSLNYAKKFLNKIGIPYKIFSFKEYYGIGIDEIVMRTGKPQLACTYCGVLRRRLFDIVALEYDLEMIFTGHNANDVSQTILLNVIQGNLDHLISKRRYIEGYIPRIYPLKYIREEEIVLYANIKKIPYYPGHCPYRPYVLRNKIRLFIEELERERQGIIYNIISLGEKLQEIEREEKLEKCMICGFPSKRRICKACEILTSFGLDNRIIKLEDIARKQ